MFKTFYYITLPHVSFVGYGTNFAITVLPTKQLATKYQKVRRYMKYFNTNFFRSILLYVSSHYFCIVNQNIFNNNKVEYTDIIIFLTAN